MSTRTYPLFRRGNPQLRIFLPNFWMKLIKPMVKQPPNKITMVVSSEMYKADVKNYLEKIYNVPVMHVKTYVRTGKTHEHKLGFIYKDDDYKIAEVTLSKDVKFEFPDVVKVEELDKKENEVPEEVEKMRKLFEKGAKTKRNAQIGRTGLPTFFGL